MFSVKTKYSQVERTPDSVKNLERSLTSFYMHALLLSLTDRESENSNKRDKNILPDIASVRRFPGNGPISSFYCSLFPVASSVSPLVFLGGIR